MGKIINFINKKTKKVISEPAKDICRFKIPSLEEVLEHEALSEHYDEDTMVDISEWNGEMWQLFMSLCAGTAAKYENKVSAWQVFAAVMSNLMEALDE